MKDPIRTATWSSYTRRKNRRLPPMSGSIWGKAATGVTGCWLLRIRGIRTLSGQSWKKRGADVSALVQRGQLVFLDAGETLARIMVGYCPEWESFERVIATAMRHVRPQTESSGLRIFGDMVGILWEDRQFTAAVRLEQFWNRLLAGSPSISLFCGYAIDVFGEDIANRSLDAMLCAHTHLLPATGGDLETAIHRAMDENLGAAAGDLKLLIQANFRPSWAAMPFAEAAALWLRKNLPNHAGRIMDSARHHYHSLRHDAALAF